MPVIGLAIVLGPCAAAPSPRPPQSPRVSTNVNDPTIAHANLKAYQTTLRRYRAGDPGVLERLLAWDRVGLRDAATLINTAADETRPWSPTDIKAAVLMQTDAVFRLLRAPDTDADAAFQLEVASRVLVRGADPWVDNRDSRLDIQNAEIRSFASRWYVGVTRLLRHRGRFSAAVNFLTLGRARLPGDAAVLHESGTLAEFVASHPAERLTRDAVSRLTSTSHLADDLLASHRAQLAEAEKWLRQALDRLPTATDTQLHLGRVLMLLGKDNEAARLLDSAARGSGEPAYLAHLFRGALEERRGSFDAARDAYAQAAARRPTAQSAAIALSHLLQRQARGDESRALLDALLARPPEDNDPWWQYFIEPDEAVAGRLAALFRELD